MAAFTALAVTLIVNHCSIVSGIVTYDNTSNSPLTNVYVILKDINTNFSYTSAATNSDGVYSLSVPDGGTYTILPETSKKWGGVYPADALTIQKYFVGLYKFKDAFKKSAGNVINDIQYPNPNPEDALMILQRFVGLKKRYNIPDWLFTPLSISVNESDITLNIKGLYAGDVNGSYIPPLKSTYTGDSTNFNNNLSQNNSLNNDSLNLGSNTNYSCTLSFDSLRKKAGDTVIFHMKVSRIFESWCIRIFGEL